MKREKRATVPWMKAMGCAIVATILLLIFVAIAMVYIEQSDNVGDCGDWDKQGIDVSHYQGIIDWDAIADETNIKYVYIKASEGASHRDSLYMRNTIEAHKRGIAVGSYHYFHPNVAVEEQYKNFMSVVNQGVQDLIPVIDIEERAWKPSKQICDSLDKFSEMVEAHWGVKPIIYTHQRFYNTLLQRSFDDHILWIARYGAYRFKPSPSLEDDRECTIWQYSNRGVVEGINGYVDLNTLDEGVKINDIMLKRRFRKHNR